jgi:S1-C subfamily serine protease
MRAGDVLLEVAGTTLASLREYSDLLKTLAPGQSVPVVFERDGQRHQASVVLADR